MAIDSVNKHGAVDACQRRKREGAVVEACKKRRHTRHASSGSDLLCGSISYSGSGTSLVFPQDPHAAKAAMIPKPINKKYYCHDPVSGIHLCLPWGPWSMRDAPLFNEKQKRKPASAQVLCTYVQVGVGTTLVSFYTYT